MWAAVSLDDGSEEKSLFFYRKKIILSEKKNKLKCFGGDMMEDASGIWKEVNGDEFD